MVARSLLAMQDVVGPQYEGGGYAPFLAPAAPCEASAPLSVPRPHPPPLGQRERSTSAPNVCYNLVSSQDFSAEVGGLQNPFVCRLQVHARASPRRGGTELGNATVDAPSSQPASQTSTDEI